MFMRCLIGKARDICCDLRSPSHASEYLHHARRPLGLLSGGTYFTLDDPVAAGTIASGINDMGQIVGQFVDANDMGQIVGQFVDANDDHGFLEVPAPNPPPPAGTTADMILRHGADGLYEIYDIGNNAILAGNFLGQVGTDFQFAGLGGFFGSDTTDMLLRSATTGTFEVYDISNNNITNAAALGTVGLNFQVAGFGDFNADGSTDMSCATPPAGSSNSTTSPITRSRRPSTSARSG
jgi:hypothetical protein